MRLALALWTRRTKMTQPYIELDIDDHVLQAHTQALAQQQRSGYPQAAKAVGEYFVSRVIERLHTQKLVDGSSMAQSKAARARGGKTLIDRGHLRDSYAYKAAGGVVQVYGGAGAAGAYAAAHHFGAKARTIKAKGKALRFFAGGALRFAKQVHLPALPARPVLGANAEDIQIVGDLILANIQRAMLASGGGK